jgi:hypothetical protein
MMKPPNGVNMTLRVVDEKKELEKEDIYLSFTDLYSKKQSWLEEQLAKGHRIFLLPKRGPAIQLSLVKYK